MAQKIQIKRGLEANLPTLDIGEPAFTTDEHGFYLGSSAGNIRMLSEEDRAAIITDAQSGVVFADRAMSLSASEKSRARANIMAGGSNPNLFDNGWFQINQRGTTSGTGGYAADRWNTTYGNGGVTWSRNSDGTLNIKSTNGASHGDFWQRIPNATYKEIAGKQCTISVMLQDGTIFSRAVTMPAFGGSLNATTINGSDANAIQFRVTYTSSVMQCEIWFWKIERSVKAIKLELGPYSTLANDAPPNYAEELVKCQRYFYRVNNFRAIATCISNGQFRVMMPTPELRTSALSQGNAILSVPNIYINGAWAVPTGTVYVTDILQNYIIWNTPHSSAVAGNSYYVRADYAQVSADL